MQKNRKTDRVYGGLLPISFATGWRTNRKGRLAAASRACPVQAATGALLLDVTAATVAQDLLAGLDVATEEMMVYKVTDGRPRTKTTLISTPGASDSVNHGATQFGEDRSCQSTAWGVFAQDTITLNPKWKVIAGLRYDRLEGDYHRNAYTGWKRVGGRWRRGDWSAEDHSRTDSVWSKRFGVLYQPTGRQSYHASFATSFNTSGDTYRLDPMGANTPPEGSENWEIGTMLHNDSKNLVTRISLYHSVKTNERDPDTVAANPDFYLLNGKRCSRGIELAVTGRITLKWELYSSCSWIPDAKIAKGLPDERMKEGDRPALTFGHSGFVWTAYDFTSRLTDRLKLNLNISNLSDKYYAGQPNSGHYISGKDRTVKIGLNYRFE